MKPIRKIICPSCGNLESFGLREPFGGKDSYKCLQCGLGFTLRLFRKPKLIPSNSWEYMEEHWRYLYEARDPIPDWWPVGDSIDQAVSKHADDVLLARKLKRLRRL